LTIKGRRIISLISLPLLSPRLWGITSPEKTVDGYEQRSRGPANRGFDALDIVKKGWPSGVGFLL
jgi:hypothetical protein